MCQAFSPSYLRLIIILTLYIKKNVSQNVFCKADLASGGVLTPPEAKSVDKTQSDTPLMKIRGALIIQIQRLSASNSRKPLYLFSKQKV